MEADNKAETEPSKSLAVHEKNKQRVSVRFQLQLTDSTDRSFPEFSYTELIGTVNKNEKKGEDVLPQDEECNIDEIRALAKKFEDKYAPKVVAKNKKNTKTDRVQDLVDVTYGYDITDSFVDDSEAYDELVPADWTTEHGGFYINMGELTFRPLSSGDEKSDSDFKDSRKKKTPKKKIKEYKEKKLKDGKRSLSSGEKEKSVKKIRLNSDDKEKKIKHKKSISADGHSNGSKDLSVGSGLTQDKDLLDNNSSRLSKTIPPVNLQSPAIKLEKSNVSDLLNSASGDVTGMPVNSSHDANENDSLTASGSAAVTLPEGLPPSLILSIQKLIEAARRAGGDGKCKFFNTDVNRILLQIETDSRKLNCRARSAVYDYLALFLPCTKETLLKRAKNLFMQEQVGRLREPLLKLRHAVEMSMPEQVRHYEEEIAKLAEDQATQSQKPCFDVASQNGEKDEPGGKSLEVEGENDKTEEATTPTDVNAPTTPVEEKGKRTIVPKRFVWKEDTRNLLCDVVKIKVELYLMSKSRSSTAEEALKGFLETEVRPIWPKGWMTTRILYRESKQAHAKVTSTIVAKVKKVLKKSKDEENTEVDAISQSRINVEPVVSKNGEEKKPQNNVTIISVSLPNGAAPSVPKAENIRQNLGNRSFTQAQIITCSPSPMRTTSQPNVTGKTILDLLDSIPGQTIQGKNNTIEKKPVVNEIKKITVVTATTTLPSCSFQTLSHQQLAQITPPRSIKPPTPVPNSSPSHSSPTRALEVKAVSPVRMVSNASGNFNPISPVSTTRLPSCSLMSSPTLPTKTNQVSVSSPISSRQNYSYINKVPSGPNLSYKFQLQSPKTNPENLQRTPHSNALPSNFMNLASPAKTKPPLTATSLLNSIARSNIPSNHVPSNTLVGQSPVVNPSSIQNPLQDIAASLNTNPHTISSIIGMQNNVMQNKPLKVHGVFPSGLSSFPGLPQQFAGQTAMHRNTTTKELKEGNNKPSSYPPTYRAPFS